MASSQPADHPVTEPPPPAALTVGGVWMIVLALFLMVCGLCSVLFYLVLPFTQPRANALETNVIFGALAGFGMLLGVAFLWQGMNALRGRASMGAARVFPHALIFIGVFFIAILLGLGALAIQNIVRGAQGSIVAAYIFPPWHFIAASVPPIALLAFAAHRLGAASGLRALLVAFGWGAMGATAVAVVVEILIGAVFVIAAAIAISLAPNSQTIINQLRAQIQLAQRTRDFSAVSSWLNDPTILAGVLLYAAVLIPFVEEAVKTLVVAFIDPLRTRLADAVLWGTAAGAGFGLFENLFNSSTTLSLWAAVAFIRIGATIMHVANGATMGRGWYAARVERRWSRLLIAYIVSVFFHAAWNAAALLLSSSAANLLAHRRADLTTTLPAASGVAALFIALVILASLGLVWMVRAVRSAQALLPREFSERSE